VLTNNDKIKTLDLFAGCGGLTDGFEQSGYFETSACVEWDKSSCATLENRLRQKWGLQDADQRVIRFDIQRTDELIKGWSNDPDYGSSPGLINLVSSKNGGVDMIIGGPPCQAYSIAGRIRDKNGMNDDYRNFLFEKYIEIVKELKPKLLIFENVPGMLSASPGGVSIVERIRAAFANAGYEISDNLRKYALVDAADFGVPQYRKRLIILGLNKKEFKHNAQELLRDFYLNMLPGLKETSFRTVSEAIADLPTLNPKNVDAQVPQGHRARYHSERDKAIFRELALDIKGVNRKYKTAEDLKRLYTERTGKVSSVHKYHVLEPDKPSTTIVAHLYKDGLRHIHPDPDQARSITVREAARLQSFDDDFAFLGSMGDQYKMIGNAVPPLLAKKIAEAIVIFIKKYANEPLSGLQNQRPGLYTQA